ncbi:MAG: DUF4249 domain-containing protein [Flavobacterium sp.]|nr:DUF4249 domain-containing protein [Flavobacterium sp.]
MNPRILIYFLLISFTFAGCVDPYQMETNTFEDAIVVEASVSNQNKQHTVKITRAYRLEDSSPTIETGATVVVTDDAGNSYDFNFDSGVYKSVTAFQAVGGRAYTLTITTSDGSVYQSSSESLTTSTEIESVEADVIIKDGQKGVQISVNSSDPSGNSKYYRYEYEETYKVVAPYWSENMASVVLDSEAGMSTGDVIVVEPRTYEARTCYSTNRSTDLIITSTTDLSSDMVQDFPVRFIAVTDPIIKHRYSVNVLQYVQSLAAYTFYKTLKELSSTGDNILAQNQPGFFYGNLQSVSDPSEKVIGFFEVSSVSQQRIFFNFEDLFPDDVPPPYLYECTTFEYNSTVFGPGDNQGATLRSQLLQGSAIYYSHVFPTYVLVRRECGDCTTFSSNVVPDFWE